MKIIYVKTKQKLISQKLNINLPKVLFNVTVAKAFVNKKGVVVIFVIFAKIVALESTVTVQKIVPNAFKVVAIAINVTCKSFVEISFFFL